MLEVIKIISRVGSGIVPIVWLFSWLMFLKKNKFEKTCGISSISLIVIGIINCILLTFGLV